MSTVRTRFAPSPTGRMHVGNLRTALYAYLIAKHENGSFMLRIEDTDQERFVDGALDIIYRTLAKTGLVHDEGPDKDGGYGPYVQSERNAQGIYLKYAKQLIEQGDAYYCFCTKERLESLKSNVGEDGKEISVYDKHCLHLSKEEVEAKNYAEYILHKREEGFREYVKNALGRYAGLTIINYNKLTTQQKLLVLFNTDIFKVIGSPDKNTMGEVFDDIKGLFDWAKSQTK